MDEIAKLKAIISADISGFERGMASVGSTLSNVGSQIAKTGVALAVLGVAAGGAFLASSISSAVDFEKSLKNIQAVTGDSSADIAALGQTLNQIGGQSVAGPQAVADAYYDIAGGVSDASVRLATLNAAIAVSEAGNANLAATTKGMISVMNAYGLSAEQAGFVSDVFTQTVSKGVGTMDEFVAAMSPLSGLANSVGYDFDKMGNDIAFMTTKGTSASEAATQIKAATTALLKPNKEMAAALKKAGFESGEAAIRQKGLAGALVAVKNAMGGSSDAMAAAVGSTEALQASVVLTSDSYDDFYSTFMTSMEGVTDAARAVQLQSVSAQFDLLKSQFSSIAIDVGSVFLPAINAILGGITSFIADVKTMGLGGALQKWFEAGMTWLQENGPGLMQSALDAAVNFVSDIGQWMIDNGPNIVWAVMDWLDGAKNWLLEQGPTIMGDAIKGAFQFTANVSEWIKTNAPNIGHAIGDWIHDAITWLVNDAPKLIGDAMAGLFGGANNDTSLSDTLRGQSSGLDQIFAPALETVKNLFGSVFGADGFIAGLIEGLFGMDEGTIKTSLDQFGANVDSAVQDAITFFQPFLTEVGKIGTMFINIGKSVFDALTKPLKDALVWFGRQLLDLADKMPVLQNELRQLGQGLVNFGGGSQYDSPAGPPKPPGYATGGWPTPGQPAIFGERGPELWVPSSRGHVMNARDTASALGGGMTFNGPITINGVTDVEGMYDALNKEGKRRNR